METANENFKKQVEIIKMKMKELNDKIKRDVEYQKNDKRNWGNVGSMIHVEEELNDIIEFLN